MGISRRKIDVPVLIIGAGPVGLSAGLFLNRLGIAHRIIERREGPQRAPAAHVVNARTFGRTTSRTSRSPSARPASRG
jgi:2-polyprenyl-6-methoxyphenol hydroxylase-like FAD-dependent oxidoreductase